MYIELLDLKSYLGIDADKEADDELLERAISFAKGWIDSYCLRTFEASANASKYFDPMTDILGGKIILRHDLCSINSIINGDGTTVTSGQYITYPRDSTPYWAIGLKSASGITWTYTNYPDDVITISGKWAYSLTAPAEIQAACYRLAAFIYRVKDSQVFDVTAMNEIGAVKVDKRMPKDVEQLLIPYRRLVAVR